MKFLVASNRHALLPYAFKLIKEGHEVQSLVWKKRFRSAWDGMLDKGTGPYTSKPEHWQPLLEDPDLVVISDTPQVSHIFRDSQRLFAQGPVTNNGLGGQSSILSLVAWFDGSRFWRPAWVIEDRGVFPGGGGADVPAGLTLIQAKDVPPQFFTVEDADKLSVEVSKGLVRFPASFDQVTKEWKKGSPQVGWSFLLSHAFIFSLGSQQLSELFLGGAINSYEKQFTIVTPVSVPPWPLNMIDTEINTKAATLNLDGTNSTQRNHLFFHDVKVNDEGRFTTAGLDGLVAVACGSGNTLASAKLRALSAARALALPQKQMRGDIGSAVDPLLVLIEELDLW